MSRIADGPRDHLLCLDEESAYSTEEESEGEEESLEETHCGFISNAIWHNALQHLYAGLAVVLGVGDITERLRYNIIQHTFWANLVLAFCLGFWIALIGLPNYSLAARYFLYGETEQTAQLQAWRGDDWDHYWCDVRANGMSEWDLENVTSCDTQNANEKEDFETQAFLNVSRSPYGKVCGYRPGRRYILDYKTFWIGNAEGNYFPTIKGNKAVYALPENFSREPILAFGASCLHACEQSRSCTSWSWKDMTSDHIFGGECQLFKGDAIVDTRLAYDWQHWIGGSCQSKAKQDFYCEENDYGKMVSDTTLTQKPQLRPWDPDAGPWSESRSQLWCGILPEKWAATWPNVVQMVVFTVFGGTGTTLKLAWQGFIGTSCACLNIFAMSLLFPHGGKVQACSHSEAANGQCVEGEMVHLSDGYREWIGWLDTLGVLFLFMASNSQTNTIKFGMSWHFFFMMDFMNPQVGRTPCPEDDKLILGSICVNEYWFVVLVTTILGCLFSVVATFVPCPLFNSRKAYQEMLSTMGAVNKIWEETVVYIGGGKRTAARYNLAAKMDAIRQMLVNVNANLEDAWWESALLCSYEPRRKLLDQIRLNLKDMVDILPAVKSCVLNQDFRGSRYQAFVRSVHRQLKTMVQNATQLTEDCLGASYARRIAPEKRERIEACLELMRKQQQDLLLVCSTHCFELSGDSVDESVLAFTVSFTSRKAADLAQLILSWDEKGSNWRCWRRHNFGHLMEGCWQGLRQTWDPRRMAGKEHLWFALRNFVGIAIVFFLAMKLDGYVFKPYQATMPATLALLISQYQNTAFLNNLHRLLGVLLGKVLPLLILSALSLLDCGSWYRLLATFLALWLYVWIFTYMYFTSESWSLVGCLIAGFGVYPLLSPCSGDLHAGQFNRRYCELGQITMALSVQLTVDFLLRRESAEDAAVRQLGKLLNPIFLCEDGERKSGLKAILESDLRALQEALQEADGCMGRARSLIVEADPKTRIISGPSTPFKISLYAASLGVLQGCLDDLTLLVMASKTWAENESVRTCEAAMASKVLSVMAESRLVRDGREQLQQDAKVVSNGLQVILSHRIEAKLEDSSWKQLLGMQRFGSFLTEYDMKDYWQELSQNLKRDKEKDELTNRLQIRVQVASRFFWQLAEKVGDLHVLCCKAHTT